MTGPVCSEHRASAVRARSALRERRSEAAVSAVVRTRAHAARAIQTRRTSCQVGPVLFAACLLFVHRASSVPLNLIRSEMAQ